MFFRKFLALVMVFIFVIVAIPNFFVYALSRTYLSTDFYKRDDFTQGVYDFAVTKTVSVLRSSSKEMSGYFSEKDLEKQIRIGFSVSVFRDIVADFANQLELYKKDTTVPLKLSLRKLRENLLTISNTLAYLIYQSLPTCSVAVSPMELLRKEVVDCVPKGVPFDLVVKPISDSFESTIYSQIPEELGNLDNVLPVKLMVQADQFRDMLFFLLLLIIVIIVLLVCEKASTVLTYLMWCFGLSGAIGFLMQYVLSKFVGMTNFNLGDAQADQFLVYVVNFFLVEFSRLSLLFLGVGVALFFIRMVVRRTVEK